MKSRTPLLSAVAATALLFTGSLLAQDMQTSEPPAQPMPAQNSEAASGSAVYQTAQGELTVNSAPAPAPSIGPAPAFEQLSAGGNGITESQAMAYTPLANDFIHADSNRNGSVSKSEYAHWTKQL